MIRSEAIPGVAFGHLADGDARTDVAARRAISETLAISEEWAFITQVHGNVVCTVTNPGHAGQADGLVTSVVGLPLAVATADCVPVVLAGARSIAVVHAGWRGVAANVVDRAVASMADLDDTVVAASIGPHIRACCYEVGDEVVAAIDAAPSRTRSGSQSVDLELAIIRQLGDTDVETFDACTHDDASFASYRRDGTPLRQVTVAWL